MGYSSRRDRLIVRANQLSMERAEQRKVLTLYDKKTESGSIRLIQQDIADLSHDIYRIKRKITELDQKNRKLHEWRTAHSRVSNPSEKGFMYWKNTDKEITWHERDLHMGKDTQESLKLKRRR